MCHHTISPEGRIDATIRIQLDQHHAVGLVIRGGTRQQDLAFGREHSGMEQCFVIQLVSKESIRGEVVIGCAIRVEAQHMGARRESGIEAHPHRDDLVIGLDQELLQVIAGVDRTDHIARAVEREVQRFGLGVPCGGTE